MGQSSGGDGGGREPGRNVAAKKQKKKVKTTFPAAPKPKPSRPIADKSAISAMSPAESSARFGTEKFGGLTPDQASSIAMPKTTPKSSPISSRRGDFQENNPFKTERGPSPGDVLATFGAVKGVDTSFESRGETYTAKNRDMVAANVAGRPGLNVANMGDLATRARVGQLPPGKVQIPGVGSAALNILNTIGKKSAGSLMRKIAGDRPTIKDGNVTYGTELVKDSSDKIMGVVNEDGSYSGRPDFNPTPSDDGQPDPVASVTKPTQQPAQPKTKPKTSAAVQRAFNLLDESGGQKIREFMGRRKDL